MTLVDYLDMKAWPTGNEAPTVAEFVELVNTCMEGVKDQDAKSAVFNASLDIVMAAFSAGYAAGIRSEKKKTQRRTASRI